MVELTKDEISEIVPKIKAYMQNEFDLEIGAFEAEFLLEFISNEISAKIYNKALTECSDEMKIRFESILDDTIYTLEK